MSFSIRREIDVEEKIYDILRKFVGKKFNDIPITEIKRQYDVGHGRRADIAVIAGGTPLLLIETKKKYAYKRPEKSFLVTSEEVLGQVFAYAAILKKRGIYVPFVATANDRQIAIFLVPEDIDKHVDWEAIEERKYGDVLRREYIYDVLFSDEYRLFHKPIRFREDFFAEILDTLTGLYAKKYKLSEKRQELHWFLIEKLRDFVDFLTPYVYDAIAPGGKLRQDLAELVENYAKERGVKLSPEQLAREMAYVLMNKIIFYKVLERYYNLPKLDPLYRQGKAKTVNEYLNRLKEFFNRAVEETKDFDPIFNTGIYDHIDIIESEEVLKAFDWLIDLIDYYKIERFGDIVGYVYEELIPEEERHQLGEFYTPKPIAELIVKWCIRSPDDKVLDPGCGSGTFLVEAYKRLVELKLKKPYSEIKHIPEHIHKQILDQLVGIDINEFAAHLTAINLAMRNPRVPSTNIKVIVEDFFNIKPGQSRWLPYKIRTAEGEKQAEIVLKDFDAIVGNPPYTRWIEIPEKVRKNIMERVGDEIRQYKIIKHITGGALPGIYIPWIIHATSFLKDGGRLGMIISDSWLQADYGRQFINYLLNEYKIHAIVDLGPRVFQLPLVGACIILMEKCKQTAEDYKITFIYLKEEENVNQLYDIIQKKERASKSGKILIIEVSANELRKKLGEGRKIFSIFFEIENIYKIRDLKEKKLLIKLSEFFDVSEGNTIWSIYASKKGRGAGVGGEDFYYLDEDKLRKYNLSKYIGTYIYYLIPSSEYLRFFTFTKSDWESISEEKFILIANDIKDRLPEEVRKYIQLGETRILIKRGPNRGKPVSQSSVAQQRKKLRFWCYHGKTFVFHDWYDLGGVLDVPIYVTYGAQYWIRFVLAKFKCALDHRILALIPKQGVTFDEVELKALLAFLNSSFSQLQAEVKGRSTGGGMLELDVKPLSEFLILNVKKLPREELQRLAQLFDKLEEEARKLGGADSAENILGTELARELTGRDIKRNVEGLFNTVIKEIDYEIARILGLEDIVEVVRTLVIDLMKRRITRAREAKTEALKGSEEEPIKRPSKRSSSSSKSGGTTTTLDRWL